MKLPDPEAPAAIAAGTRQLIVRKSDQALFRALQGLTRIRSTGDRVELIGSRLRIGKHRVQHRVDGAQRVLKAPGRYRFLWQ